MISCLVYFWAGRNVQRLSAGRNVQTIECHFSNPKGTDQTKDQKIKDSYDKASQEKPGKVKQDRIQDKA
jgi:hypothetical protein